MHATSRLVIRQQSRSNHFVAVMTAATGSLKTEREVTYPQVPLNAFSSDSWQRTVWFNILCNLFPYCSLSSAPHQGAAGGEQQHAAEEGQGTLPTSLAKADQEV